MKLICFLRCLVVHAPKKNNWTNLNKEQNGYNCFLPTSIGKGQLSIGHQFSSCIFSFGILFSPPPLKKSLFHICKFTVNISFERINNLSYDFINHCTLYGWRIESCIILVNCFQPTYLTNDKKKDPKERNSFGIPPEFLGPGSKRPPGGRNC